MTRQVPEWHQQARKMRAAGATKTLIAERFGRTRQAVSWALNEEGARDTVRARIRRMRAQRPEPVAKPTVDTMAICRDFAAGNIDRATLSRRLRGEP